MTAAESLLIANNMQVANRPNIVDGCKTQIQVTVRKGMTPECSPSDCKMVATCKRGYVATVHHSDGSGMPYLAACVCATPPLVGHACVFQISPHWLSIPYLNTIFANVKLQKLARPA